MRLWLYRWWFFLSGLSCGFINRASSRTNEQIELLEALLDQQKRQNALLRRLCEANEPEKADKKTVESQKSVEDEDIIRLVAER